MSAIRRTWPENASRPRQPRRTALVGALAWGIVCLTAADAAWAAEAAASPQAVDFPVGRLFTVMTEKYAKLIQAMRQTMDHVAHDFLLPPAKGAVAENPVEQVQRVPR